MTQPFGQNFDLKLRLVHRHQKQQNVVDASKPKNLIGELRFKWSRSSESRATCSLRWSSVHGPIRLSTTLYSSLYLQVQFETQSSDRLRDIMGYIQSVSRVGNVGSTDPSSSLLRAQKLRGQVAELKTKLDRTQGVLHTVQHTDTHTPRQREWHRR